jgi:hypothetical protein
MRLISHGVMVGIGCEEIWSARNLPFDVAWVRVVLNDAAIYFMNLVSQVAIEAGGTISKETALAIGSVNIEKLLGVTELGGEDMDLVATRGGDLLDLSSKVVAVISPTRKLVDIME